MKVYAIEAYGNYGAGMAVIAADSKEEAIAIAEKIDGNIWNVRYGKPTNVQLLPCICDGPARVLTHFETGE